MAILWRRRLKNNQFFFIPKNGNILLRLTSHIFQGAHSLFKLFELYQNLQQKNKHTHFQGSKTAIFGPFFDHFWLLTVLWPSARLGTAIISFFYLFSVGSIPRPNLQAKAKSFLGFSQYVAARSQLFLYVRSKVHFMNKLLSFGKKIVIVGQYRDICILKFVNFCPLMASDT